MTKDQYILELTKLFRTPVTDIFGEAQNVAGWNAALVETIKLANRLGDSEIPKPNQELSVEEFLTQRLPMQAWTFPEEELQKFTECMRTEQFLAATKIYKNWTKVDVRTAKKAIDTLRNEAHEAGYNIKPYLL